MTNMARRLAMIEVRHAAGATKPRDVATDYVLVLDRSGSMQGVRRNHLLAGLRTLLQLVAVTETGDGGDSGGGGGGDVTLVAFNQKAEVIYGPGSAAGALANWGEEGGGGEGVGSSITDALHATGGTSMEEALTVALRVAEAKLQRGRAVVMLLLTDGEDDGFAQSVRRFRAAQPGAVGGGGGAAAVLLEQLGKRSGLAMHFVGICAEADSALLGGLAQLAEGTFVSIADDTIKGLMGSLLGLVMETLPHAARLTVRSVSETWAEGTSVLVQSRPVLLRMGASAPTTRVPFRLPKRMADGGGVVVVVVGNGCGVV